MEEQAQVLISSNFLLGLREDELLPQNWLTDGCSVAHYECPGCKTVYCIDISNRIPSSATKSHIHLCMCEPENPKQCEYMGSSPRQVNIMTKVIFEKNGRIGIKTTLADGKQTVRSMSKEKSIQMVERGEAIDKVTKKRKSTDSVYTPAYKKKIDADKKELVRKNHQMMIDNIARENSIRRNK